MAQGRPGHFDFDAARGHDECAAELAGKIPNVLRDHILPRWQHMDVPEARSA